MSPESGRPVRPSDALEPQTDDTLQLLRPSGSGLGSRRPGAPGWSEGGAPVFAPGEIVADRFRIAGFIAQGGMGQVYEAEDLELDERVALKTVRGEIAAEERALVRFKREVHLARRVTHPNVCRIYDVFRHAPDAPAAPGGGAGRPALVLAMELLPGETLAARLKRDGPFAPEEALPIIEQMAAGLAAAHRAGVVHRDFNPKNVMLVPAAGAPGGVRAVVTDFGLAHAAAGEVPHDVSVTAPGMAAGTPAYMAPEQIEGADLTGAADVYALGVVLFEMLTGKWPFAGATALSTAVKRLQEAPPSPRIHAPDLPARWEAVILKCLERRPEDRYASALDVARELASASDAAAVPTVRPEPAAGRRRARVAGAVAVLAAVIALAIVLAVGQRPQPAPAAPAGQAMRPAFAVLGFKNLSGRPDADWLSVGFSEMLTTELAAGNSLRAVPAETVARAKAELELQEAQSLEPETLAQLRRLTAVDLVVLGSYVLLGGAGGGQVRLDVQLQRATTGETLATLAERGTEAELFDLVTRVGAQLRDRIGVAEPAAGERAGVAAALPGSPEAARLYAEGLARLRAQDLLAARDLLTKAAEAEPDHPLVHAALARVWSGLGYDARAVDSARRASELSEALPQEDRLLVEARFHEVSEEWPKAVEIYRSLWVVFPDQLEHGLALARAQTRAGQAAAALATIAELHALPEPSGGDPRIDLEEAEAARAQSDFRRQREAAARAVERASARGARLLAAQGRGLLGSALHRLGLPREALAAYTDAERAFLAVGDRGGAARMLGLQAIVRADLGELAEARQLHERAEAIHRETGDRGATAASLTNLGIVLRRQGDLAEAERAYREALAIFRDTGDRAAESRALTSLANVLADQGNLAAARETYERSLAIKRALGDDRGGVAGVLGNLAEIHAETGDLDDARRLREEALAIDRELGDKAGIAADLVGLGEVLALSGDLAGAARRHEEGLSVAREIGSRSLEAWALFGLGEVLRARGDLAAARQRHEAALTLRLQVGEAVEVAESRLALARVALAAGDPTTAERLAREAADAFGAERQRAREAEARDLLARAQGARGTGGR